MDYRPDKAGDANVIHGTNMNIIDILFIICLILLYFLPRKSEKYKYYWIIPLIIFFIGIGIRVHSKIESHNKSEEITDLHSQIVELEKDREEKEKKINSLENEAKNAKRGITENFFANGTKRSTDGGNIILDKKLNEIYEQMKSLSEENKYPELITLCREQIKKNEDWPTPYLFLGVALGNLGKRDEGIHQLEYFIAIAPTLPTYGYVNYLKQAKDFIDILKK